MDILQINEKPAEVTLGKVRKPIVTLIILLFLMPIAYAGNYGAGTYGIDEYNVGETAVAKSSDPVSSGSGGGLRGGAGGGFAKPVVEIEEAECTQDVDCGTAEYCFEAMCYAAECSSDSACRLDEVCHQHRCAKLFDIEIKEFESPASLGDFFDFTYLVKGMAEFNDDVIINFKIESDGKIVTSGQDVIYLASFEEKTKTTKLFLPSTVDSGVYIFSVEVAYGHYKAVSFRTIEISVNGEGTAEIKFLAEESSMIKSFIQSAIKGGRDKIQPILQQYPYWILSGCGFVLLSFFVIIAKKKSKKPKRKRSRK
jgi:hypothetical protein